MSENDGGDFGSFLAGFVIGGLVGAAAALVLAPQSGAETRSRITGKGHDVLSAGEERYQSAVTSAEAYAQQVGERANQFSQDLEEKTRIVLDEGLQPSVTSEDEGVSITDEDTEIEGTEEI